MKKGGCGTMTQDKRSGITILFAALKVLGSTVIVGCIQQHRHQEFIRFLNVIGATVSKGEAIQKRSSKGPRPNSCFSC
jgi:hypothetical protein